MTTTLTSRGGWIGWVRLPRRRWVKAVESDSHDDALAALLTYAGKLPDPHKDLTVLRVGTDPNRKPARYARVKREEIDFVKAGEQR